MFLDDSACNLASINLMKFVGPEDDPHAGELDVVAVEAACRTLITAQEILVDNSSYPTPAIAKNSHDYRPLGLGYANLGALLMSRGLPFTNSVAGRDYAAAIDGPDARRGLRAVAPGAWRSPSRTRRCSTRLGACSRRPTSEPPSWPSSTASSRVSRPSSTCSRCTSWSATSSRRSSTRRSSTSGSTTSRPASRTSRTPSSAESASRTSRRRSPRRRSSSSPRALQW